LCKLCLSGFLCLQQSLLSQSQIFWGSSPRLKECCWVSDLCEWSSNWSHGEDKETHELFPNWCWRTFPNPSTCLAFHLARFSFPFKRTVLAAIINHFLLQQVTVYQALQDIRIRFRNQPNINEFKLLNCMYS
jgi:hypothetical protein